MKLHRVLFPLILSPVVLTTGFAQDTRNYVSFVAGFKVSLPAEVRGYNGMGSGLRLTWQQPEAEYEIGFHERQGLPLAEVNGEFSYEEAVRRYFNKFSSVGERIYVRDAVLEKNRGFEYKFRTRDSIYLLRLFLVDDRLYQLQAQIPLAKASNEQPVLSVFDSVKLLGREETARHFAKQIEDATPNALPQSPKVSKTRSDAQDRNLKGHVRSVKSEFATYALNDSLKQKYTTLYEEFDRDGNLVKAIEYDSLGSPTKVTVYGYMAGKRVARVGSIQQQGIGFGVAIEFPRQSRFDKRFDEYSTYRYLNGMLAEERTFWSNGALFRRATYRFMKNTKITEYFGGGAKPFRRLVAYLDDNGNEIKLTPFEPDGRKWKEEAHFDIKYDSFDEKGNWTQRSTSRWYGMDGRGKTFPEHVEYRVIQYFQ